jgi:hypothetical protein
MFPFFPQTKIEKLLAGRTEISAVRSLHMHTGGQVIRVAMVSLAMVWRVAMVPPAVEREMQSGLRFLVSSRDHRPRDGPPIGQDAAPSLAMAVSPCGLGASPHSWPMVGADGPSAAEKRGRRSRGVARTGGNMEALEGAWPARKGAAA